MKAKIGLICLVALAACNSQAREIEAAVSEKMKDPDSTKFRDIEPCSADPNVFTGEYNSKNGYGAYNGFKRFFYANGMPQFLDEDDFGLDRFEELAKRCYGKLYSDPAAEAKSDASEAAAGAADVAPSAKADKAESSGAEVAPSDADKSVYD